jgi:hypothetical protein
VIEEFFRCCSGPDSLPSQNNNNDSKKSQSHNGAVVARLLQSQSGSGSNNSGLEATVVTALSMIQDCTEKTMHFNMHVEHVGTKICDSHITNNNGDTTNNHGTTDRRDSVILDTLAEHRSILAKIDHQTEARPLPPSALRDERNREAQEGATKIIFDLEGSSPARQIDHKSTSIDNLKTMTWSQIVNFLQGQGGPVMLLSHSDMGNPRECAALIDTDIQLSNTHESLFNNTFGYSDPTVTIDTSEHSVTIVWNGKDDKCAAELILLVIKAANIAALSSAEDVTVEGATVDNHGNGVIGHLPVSADDLNNMKCCGNIVFKKIQFTEDQEAGIAGVSTEVTLADCQLPR